MHRSPCAEKNGGEAGGDDFKCAATFVWFVHPADPRPRASHVSTRDLDEDVNFNNAVVAQKKRLYDKWTRYLFNNCHKEAVESGGGAAS